MYDRLINTLAGIGAVGMLGMALYISYEVVMRYFFNNPTIWAGDLSEYTLLWGTFLAAPWLVREGGHVSLDTVTHRLSPTVQHRLGVISSIIAAAVCVVLLWQGLDATLDAYTRGQIIARSWQVPRWIVWAAIPVGSLFLTIEFIRAAVRSARAVRDEAAFVHHAAEERVI
jgi:C4-dicarboxylate transporter DctQ subunit